MKQALFILFLGIQFAGVSSGFSGEDLGDPVLERLKSNLPKGWTITRNKNELILERLEPCWLMMENRINAPMSRETEADLKKRFMENGKKDSPKILIRLETDWSEEKVKTVKTQNARVYQEIENLRVQMGMPGLRNQFLSSKGGEFLVPKTKADEEKITKFKAGSFRA